MQKSLFERIINKVVAYDKFFERKCDVVGCLNILWTQKYIAASDVNQVSWSNFGLVLSGCWLFKLEFHMVENSKLNILK